MTWTPPDNTPVGSQLTTQQREELRERFRKVILLAGYQNPELILAEWFEQYVQKDLPGFLQMLDEYEKHKGDPP